MLDPIFILLIGMLIVVGGIIWFKLHPFLALLFASLLVGFLTSPEAIVQFGLSKGLSAATALAMGKKSLGERVTTEFGNTCAKVGVLISMAAIIGKCMLESGSAERIIRSLLKITGIRKAPLAFLTGSFFLGIPVFFDTVIFLMIPLAKAMALRIKKNYLLLLLSIMAGAAMANSLVPPSPGPLFLIGEMHIPIGLMMIAGFITGAFTITAGYIFAVWANKKWPMVLRDDVDAKLTDLQAISDLEDNHLPSIWLSLLPVLIPLLLICTDTFCNGMLTNGNASKPSGFLKSFLDTIKFLGDKNIAVSLGAIVALWIVGKYKKNKSENLTTFVQAALMSGGGIILITAAGGAFGGMLQQTGISAEIASLTQSYQMALIPMAFFIAALVRTAQGSATVALITTSGILSGMASDPHLAFNPVYLGLAIGCGSKLVPWMNDAGFWIFCKLSNMSEKEALRTVSPQLVVMGFTGLIVILIGARLFPLI